MKLPSSAKGGPDLFQTNHSRKEDILGFGGVSQRPPHLESLGLDHRVLFVLIFAQKLVVALHQLSGKSIEKVKRCDGSERIRAHSRRVVHGKK